MLRRTRAKCPVRSFRHLVHARGVNPPVVKVEQRTHGNGVVDGFVGPARGAERRHVLRCDLRRLVVHFGDETE